MCCEHAIARCRVGGFLTPFRLSQIPAVISSLQSLSDWAFKPRGEAMRRRDFILGLGGAALWSKAAQGQQTVPVVGVLEVGTAGIRSKDFFAPALTRLAEMGFVEGRNLTIEYRGADFQQERLAGLASTSFSAGSLRSSRWVGRRQLLPRRSPRPSRSFSEPVLTR
jgi:hypothetical protein